MQKKKYVGKKSTKFGYCSKYSHESRFVGALDFVLLEGSAAHCFVIKIYFAIERTWFGERQCTKEALVPMSSN